MSGIDTFTQIIAELELRKSAELYAQAADRRDKTQWNAVLTDDCVIEGPGFRIAGREATMGTIDMLAQSFRSTVHHIHNQVVQVNGDIAKGETYCTANHLLNDAEMILVMEIRYQDEWRREGGVWRFTKRLLVIDWEETRPVLVKIVRT